MKFIALSILALLGMTASGHAVAPIMIDQYLKIMPAGCWETDRSTGIVSQLEVPGQPTAKVDAMDTTKSITFKLFEKNGRLWGYNKHNDFFIAKEPFSVTQLSENELLGAYHLAMVTENGETDFAPSWHRATISADRISFVSEDPNYVVKSCEYIKTGDNKIMIDAQLSGPDFPNGGRYFFHLKRVDCPQ